MLHYNVAMRYLPVARHGGDAIAHDGDDCSASRSAHSTSSLWFVAVPIGESLRGEPMI
jgi:hypothetical protein